MLAPLPSGKRQTVMRLFLETNFGLWTKGELNLDAGMPKHGNQSVNAESFPPNRAAARACVSRSERMSLLI
jgi:hypothetical protein